MNNLISIIIPYYNKGRTINRAIESVLKQTYRNWEVIIVDDCSQEELKLEDYCLELPILIERNNSNMGPGPTRQRGMELAKGDYYAFLDADDYYHPNFLEKSLKGHLSQSNISATWVRSYVINPDFNIALRRNNALLFENIQETLIRYSHPWQTGSFLWKKQYCGSWGNLSTNQDSWFEFSSSLLCNKVLPIPEALMYHDKSGDDHRPKYVERPIIFLNNFKLYLNISKNIHAETALLIRIVLFHRLLRCLLKISENCDENDFLESYSLLKEQYGSRMIFFKNPFILKLAHKFLQSTRFKLYY